MNTQEFSPMPAAAAGLPFAIMQSCLSLYDMRTRAIADYWQALNAARRPEEVMGAQLDYWTSMLRDYAAAAAEASVVAQPGAEPAAHPETGQVRAA
jgi:hypothetical protein